MLLTLSHCYVVPACSQVFLEETSLVARPAVPFPDLKERLDARMKHLGIKVRFPTCNVTHVVTFCDLQFGMQCNMHCDGKAAVYDLAPFKVCCELP
jgi:hypothetical protein